MTAAARPASAARSLVPPLAAFALARLVLSLVARRAGQDPFAAASWARWDSHLYAMIARLGYTLEHCGRGTGYPPDAWCGTAGWFPGYPLLLAAGARAGVPAFTTGAIASAILHAGTLVVVWNGLLGARAGRRELAVLLLAAFFPGFVYQHAVYPVSALAFFAVLAISAILADRWLLAGFAAFAAALFHPTAVPIAGALFAWSAWKHRALARAEVAKRALVPAALAALGYASVHVAIGLSTGAFDGFFRIQAKYGHGLSNPFSTLVQVLAPIVRGGPEWAVVQAWQSLVTLAIVAVAIAATIRARREPGVEAGVLACTYLVALWLFPLLMGPKVGFYRSEAMLLPAAVALRFAPAPLTLALCAGSAWAGARVADAYFRNLIA